MHLKKRRRSTGRVSVCCLFPNDLHQRALAPAAVKLPAENLFPRPKIQAPFRHRDDHFPPHGLPLVMRVGIILAGVIVPVLAHRVVRCHLLQPCVIDVVQARFIVVDEYRPRDVQEIGAALTITTIV